MGEGDRVKRAALVVLSSRRLRLALLVLVVLLCSCDRDRLHDLVTYSMPSGSMYPAIKEGQIFLGDKRPYLAGDPQPGDIAVFSYPPDSSVQYVKRVTGLPGDTVEIHEGKLLVNGLPVADNFMESPTHDYGPVVLPANMYFVLGDNINHSSDSRVWGFVPRGNFACKVIWY